MLVFNLQTTFTK